MQDIPKIDFLVVASARGGTTWLHKCLQDHPQICFSKKKEFVPFDIDGALLAKEIEEQFDTCCKPGALRGAMPIMLNTIAKSSQWVKKYYPKAKIIMCLRNPIERAYSNYKYNVSRGVFSDKSNFGEIIRNNPTFLRTGLYADTVCSYWRDLGKENVLILFSEEMANKQAESLKRVQRFLDIEERNSEFTYTYMSVSREGRKIYNSFFLLYLRRFLLGLNHTVRKIGGPGIGKIITAAKLGAITNFISRINYKGSVDGVPENSMEGDTNLNSDDREYLRNYYAADIAKLSKLLGMELSWG